MQQRQLHRKEALEYSWGYMAIYYIHAYPEIIVSLVRTGKLPSSTSIKSLLGMKSLEQCVSDNTLSLDQLFILKIEIQIPDEHEFVILDALDTSLIQNILVFSLPASQLLNQLFQNNCPKKVLVKPHAFSSRLVSSASSSSSGFFKANKESAPITPSKRDRQQEAGPSSTPSKRSRSIQEPKEVSITRLSTQKEHLHWLRHAFLNAKISILITSYSINHETLTEAGLFELIPAAVERGVRVYVYYNDMHEIPHEIKEFFNRHDVFCEPTYTHSKILTIDKQCVISGSFNWLSAKNRHFEPSEDGSLCIQGDIAGAIIEELWRYIKYYRNEQYGNIGALERFERNPNNFASLVFPVDSKSEIQYIPTLEEHRGFLTECFEQAKQRIIICSPFISGTKTYRDDIDYSILQKALSRRVNVYFICSSEAPNLTAFGEFLKRRGSSRIHLITVRNIHLKTIIIDDNIIAEGSFNWLSAARNRLSEYHNHEQTLLVQGEKSKPLIKHFFESMVGEVISCIESVEQERSALFTP